MTRRRGHGAKIHTCTHAHMHTAYIHAHIAKAYNAWGQDTYMHTCTHAHMHRCTDAQMHTSPRLTTRMGPSCFSVAVTAEASSHAHNTCTHTDTHSCTQTHRHTYMHTCTQHKGLQCIGPSSFNLAVTAEGSCTACTIASKI